MNRISYRPRLRSHPASTHGTIQSGGAFSLIELMVVLALIGIMTALIIPQMKGTFEDVLLRSTGRTLVDAFNLASSRAITIQQPHRVRIDQKAGRFFVQQSSREGEKEGERLSVRDVPGGAGEIDNRITVEVRKLGDESAEEPGQESAFVSGDDLRNQKRGQALTFYPDGTADAAEILLKDREGFRLGLKINPVTARVHIMQLERE